MWAKNPSSQFAFFSTWLMCCQTLSLNQRHISLVLMQPTIVYLRKKNSSSKKGGWLLFRIAISLISLIFEKCSMLLQTQSRLNHIHPTEIYISMNLLQMPCVGSKKTSNIRKKMRPFFSFKYQNFRARVNHKIKPIKYNGTK